MENKQAKISILMCVYNEEKFIAEAINSVIAQTYKNFELIIIDDGSTDNTSKIVVNFLSDNRIKFFQPGRLGKVKANNFAYEKSSGEFITFFSGDDLMLKESIQKRLESIISLTEPAISFCRLKTLSKDKQFDNLILPRNVKRGNLCAGCMIFNKKFANISFPIPEFLGNEDMWNVQHANYYPGVLVKHIPYIGLRYRLHDNNSSSKFDSFDKKTQSMHKRFIVYKTYLDTYRGILSSKSVDKLKSLGLAEDLRYNNKTISILFVNNLSLTEKIRFFFYSNKFLYRIRQKLFSFFSGW